MFVCVVSLGERARACVRACSVCHFPAGWRLFLFTSKVQEFPSNYLHLRCNTSPALIILVSIIGSNTNNWTIGLSCPDNDNNLWSNQLYIHLLDLCSRSDLVPFFSYFDRVSFSFLFLSSAFFVCDSDQTRQLIMR